MPPPNRSKQDGEQIDLCVMALAVQNHTRFFETKTAEDLLDHLNTLFGIFEEVIERRGGSLANFAGENCLAVFGAPDHDGCPDAVDTARKVLDQTETEIRRKTISPTSVQIALHYGPVIAGFVGPPKARLYTVLGDTVEIARRINRLYNRQDSGILISDAVLNRIQITAGAPVESLGPMPVKGFLDPIEVFRLP